MNDILRDFEKKNEIPKIDLSGVDFAMKNINTIFDDIAKDIRERQDNAMAMEFTKCIGELLRKNGVIPKITEYTREIAKEHSIEQLYGVSIDELDFSEHDKTFVDRIVELQIKNNHLVDEKNKLREIINKKLGGWDDYGVSFEEIFGMREENKELKQRIDELEKELEEWKEEARVVKKQRDEQLKSFRKAVEPYVDVANMHETIAELKQRIAELESKNNQLTESILRKETKIHELESKETENTVEVRVPASPIEIATYLINNICTINELKMIAEHINVYCNGGK